jgi:hypothetical protein
LLTVFVRPTGVGNDSAMIGARSGRCTGVGLFPVRLDERYHYDSLRQLQMRPTDFINAFNCGSASQNGEGSNPYAFVKTWPQNGSD